jgi:hypothetical protein
MKRIDVINGLSSQQYHSDYREYISSTMLKGYCESALNYKYKQSEPREFKAHFLKGSLWHDTIAARHRDGIPLENIYAFVDYPDYMINKGKPYGTTSQAYADGILRLKEEYPSKEIIFPDMKATVDQMIVNLFQPKWKHPSLPLFMKMFEKGVPEVSYFIKDFAEGINIKFRPDLDGENFFIDYKTTDKPLSEFPRVIAEYGYDISAAMYREGKREVWREYYGDDGNHRMYWLVQQVNPPYDWALFCADNLIEQATVKFYDLLSYHDLCRQQNEYGGIASLSSDKYGVFFPDLPTWKQKFNPLQG